MSNYSEKLKDPRWQKKRLEILNRDEFTCRYCGDKETTLHVHHSYYNTGMQPWEYHNNELITICGDCHSAEHIKLTDLERFLWQALREKLENEPISERKSLTKIILNKEIF